MKRSTAFLTVLCLLAIIFYLFPRSENPAQATASAQSSLPFPAKNAFKKDSMPTGRRELSPFAKAIEDENLCDNSGNYLNSSATLLEKYQALSRANKKKVNPCTLALLTKDKKQALYFANKSPSETCQFIKALYLTDQMDGLQDPTPSSASDYAAGTEILEKLARESPGNGVYPFYILGAAEKSKQKTIAAESAIENFLTMRSFQSPIITNLIEVRELGHLNPVSLLYAIEIASAHNWPDSTQPLILLRELSGAEEYKIAFQEWTREVLREMQAIDEAELTEPFVALVDWAIMKSVAVVWWKKFSPDTPLPELLEQEGFKAFYQRRLPKFDPRESFSNELSSCNDTLLDMRKYFPKAISFEKEKIENWRRFH